MQSSSEFFFSIERQKTWKFSVWLEFNQNKLQNDLFVKKLELRFRDSDEMKLDKFFNQFSPREKSQTRERKWIMFPHANAAKENRCLHTFTTLRNCYCNADEVERRNTRISIIMHKSLLIFSFLENSIKTLQSRVPLHRLCVFFLWRGFAGMALELDRKLKVCWSVLSWFIFEVILENESVLQIKKFWH